MYLICFVPAREKVSLYIRYRPLYVCIKKRCGSNENNQGGGSLKIFMDDDNIPLRLDEDRRLDAPPLRSCAAQAPDGPQTR
jgi:hypothetical protein